MLTSKQRQNLKSLAHSLDPVIRIGKNGLTEQSLVTIEKALADHQLIKIKFLDFKDEKNNFIKSIEERTDAVLIEVIGNVVILFKENPDSEKQLIY
ncbi:ribosome assembly RNA-binding protein YhbY [Candidatus Bathyarchaeota archaeon]|nr:ribosome assembly RNA-binding protein YhbY [Candidatus Bathyarchaeota archaeon]